MKSTISTISQWCGVACMHACMRTPTHAAFGIIRKFSGIPHHSWGSRPASSVCFKADLEAIRCAAEGRQTHRSDSAAPPPFRRWQITVGLPKNAMPPWERNTSHLYFFFFEQGTPSFQASLENKARECDTQMPLFCCLPAVEGDHRVSHFIFRLALIHWVS